MVLHLLFSMDAFRCRSCRARFHKYDPGAKAEEAGVEKTRRGRRDDDESQS
jgi:hypothetical protein